MYELKKMESYLRVNLLGPGPRLIKKNLPGRDLTKAEKHRHNSYHMTKESGHREYNEKRGTKEGKGIFLVLRSIGSSVVTKYCGEKANKLVK